MRSTQEMFSTEDLQTLAKKEISVENILAQIELFKSGVPFLTLERPCTIGDGITRFTQTALDHYRAIHAHAAAQGRMMKLVPASGAASRMFQLLLSVAEATATLNEAEIARAADNGNGDLQAIKQFVTDLPRFAFYDDLCAIMARDGFALETLVKEKHCKAILHYLLTPTGLDYANLPKALIKFHRYPDHVRTSAEEHLVEATAYARDQEGVAHIHFTVSPEHQAALHQYLESVRARYEHDGWQLRITFSNQKPSTDTIAVDAENEPFRTIDGQLVFRPGGHGALLANLSDLQGDIVFIKNIDNVVPERLQSHTWSYKEALSGYLLETQKKIFHYVYGLSQSFLDKRLLAEAYEFAHRELAIVAPFPFQQASIAQQRAFLLERLHRPLRVCGVVKNTGEPGGGPFWVRQRTGEVSRQIVESSQVDMQSPQQQEIWRSASHFNPVDLVCGMRDYQGQAFDLAQFTDPETAFISRKSKDGKELKALELPGLWNGAMAKWNTLFVEVPAITFNPVKTIFDLLRPEHQEGL
ncbi:MAG: DUF4301 family protein [Candidatus Binatia bacterium]